MAKKPLYILFSIFLLVTLRKAEGQNVFSSEDDLKKQANKLFDDEEFAKAYPLFSQLLSLYPKDAQYNYKFGTCLLYSAGDKEKAIPYIDYAAKRQNQDVDKEVFFYLGKAYHLNYRFEDAIRMYKKYQAVASGKKAEHYDVAHQIEMCENGKKLLKNVTDLSVLEKKEVNETDFFRSYNLSEFNAKIIAKPDELKSSVDKKKKDESIMYLAPDRKEIYYSSYGEDGKTGKDIYMVTKTSSGDLSKPTKLGDNINTKYDEDYPFLHPSGRILYFCSKGHNSMGGYDIFKCEWDDKTNSWGKPVNMDFAINTPDDDILFISDSEDKSAYFSSRRESAQGMLSVYKIKLERKPLDIAIIKGTLTKEVGDKVPNAKITVSKVLKDEVVGVFNTGSDGSYALNLPNGGKFMFTVESQGFKKSSELVVVPNQVELKPLKQEIALVSENGADKLKIKNSFEAEIDSNDLALATQFIKAKAALEVSPPEQEVTAVAVDENKSSTENKTENNKTAPVSNTEIIGMAYDEAKQTQKEANELRKNSDAAQQLANQKNEASLQKNKEATELAKTADAITNQDEKMAQLDKATKLRKEADEFSKEAAMSLTLANQMDEQGKAKQTQADEELKYAKEFETAVKSGASEKKMNDLLAQKEALDKKSDELKNAFPPDYNKQADVKQKESSKALAKYIDIQQDVEDLQKEATRLRNEAAKTKNDAAKQNMISQAEEMEKEAATKKQDAEKYNVQGKQLQAQADSLRNTGAFTSSVLKEIQELPTNVAMAEKTSQPEKNTSPDTAIKAVAVKETLPLKISSPYVDVFVAQMHEAEKIPKELERQEKLSVIYQQWTDSLDAQIASLNKLLPTITNENDKKYAQDKIYELQSGADDKRQRASDSRNTVDNLKLQEALAAASNVTPETSAVATNTISPTATNTTTATNSSQSSNPQVNQSTISETTAENIKGTDNINSFYENKLKANEKETNEFTKKSNEEKIYSDWSSSLYDESQRLKKDGKNGKASDAEKLSKEKQTVAEQAANKVTEIKAEHPELVEAAKTKQQEQNAATSTASTQTTTATENKTTTETSVQPINTSTTSTTSATTASTKTVTETNPVATQTVSPVKTETVTASTNATQPKNSTTQQFSNTTFPSNPPENVKSKDEYTHFVALKNESDWARKNAERDNKQADEIQKVADEQFKESDNVTKQLQTAKDANEMLKLQFKSDELNRKAFKSKAKADSLRALAKNSEAEANSKQTESDLYLNTLDKSAYEEITTSTGYTPKTLASNTTKTSSENKTNKTNTASTKTVTPTNSNKTTTNKNTTQTAKTNSVTLTQTASNKTNSTQTATAKTNSVTPTKTETAKTNSGTPTKTETAKTNTVSTTASTEIKNNVQPETTAVNTNTITATETAKTNTVTASENKNPREATTVYANTAPKESTATKTNSVTETSSTATKTETQPKNNSTTQPINNSSTPNAALLKYYDALWDKLDLAGGSYSASKPIPVDAPMPDGLVFKVQIGAFRNPIPQNLFKGIKPITAETAGGGLKRYSAGLFQKFSSASAAKKQVNDLGYKDAFIVAFFNGKRISINEAMTKAKENGETIDASVFANQSTNPPINESSNQANATDVKNVSGLFYAIQVGVFSKPVSSTQLYNISPLNSEKTDNGLIRYTTGRFSDEVKANQAKSRIAGKGIADAFVVAYYNGKRIPLTEAKKLIDTQGSSVVTSGKQEYSFFPSDTTTSEKSAVNLTASENKGVVFKVQVGAYREQVPIEDANKLLKLSGKGIKTFTDENSLMVYTVGEFLEYETANKLKSEIINSGISGAFVIAFRDGKKLSAQEALDLIKK